MLGGVPLRQYDSEDSMGAFGGAASHFVFSDFDTPEKEDDAMRNNS